MKKIANVIPLFWVKGESEEILLDGLRQLRSSGVKECIVEARPFPEWLGKAWFDTLKCLFAEAEKSSMRLWLFDDCHFPSGGAGGRIPEKYRKVLLRCISVPLEGPGKFTLAFPPQENETLFCAVTAPVSGRDGFDGRTAQKWTAAPDGRVDFSVPEGKHRFFAVLKTRDGGEEHTRNYVNMLDPEAVKSFIEIAYETHYRELRRYFENGVMAGFFSDEPRFGSAPNYTSLPDGTDRCLPFSEVLAEKLSDVPAAFWPSLWHDAGEDTPRFRARYMDTVSRLYSQSFPRQIGAWCRAHGTAYLGHVVEDNGAHSRLGYGTGHFFRSMQGQTAPMVDSVLHQNLPGAADGFHTTGFGTYDSSFFHWGLAKLASSAAHLMPEFAGRAGCECFGANGWSCGLESMKRLTDHFAVRGINFFVPHAFSNAPFPDMDCPPHFYAQGHNPQWPYFKDWRTYCSRVCDMLSDGIHLAGTAVLYHAEAEWSTRFFEPFHTAVAGLMKHRLDCDVVPFDLLAKAAVSGGVMKLNGESFSLLVLPEAEYLPQNCREILAGLRKQGLKTVSSRNVLQAAEEIQPYPVRSASEFLRVYRYQVQKEVRIFLVNESEVHPVCFRLPPGGSFFYDAMTGEQYRWRTSGTLEPGESLFAVYGEDAPPGLLEYPMGKLDVWNADFSLPDKNGVRRCRTKEPAPGDRIFLDCGNPGGTVVAEWNGQALPPRFAPPFRIEITRYLKQDNTFKLETVSPVEPSSGGIFDRGIPRRLPVPGFPRLTVLHQA